MFIGDRIFSIFAKEEYALLIGICRRVRRLKHDMTIENAHYTRLLMMRTRAFRFDDADRIVAMSTAVYRDAACTDAMIPFRKMLRINL